MTPRPPLGLPHKVVHTGVIWGGLHDAMTMSRQLLALLQARRMEDQSTHSPHSRPPTLQENCAA